MGGAVEPAGGNAELTDPRVAAFRVLEDVEDGAYADRASERRLAGVPPLQRALALELAYGCIRLRARLDAELAALVDRPLRSLDRVVLLWLRLGLYQLRETRISDHAAVNETVAGFKVAAAAPGSPIAARRGAGSRAAGYINAVLRAAARLGLEERARFFPSPVEDPVGYLCSYGSHPEWLVRRWLTRWPAEVVARLVELDNRPPSVTLRTLGDTAGRRAADERAGAEPGLTPVPGFPGCWRLEAGDPTELVARLPAVVQDPAASAVVEYLGCSEGGVLADVCAAPGGKAIAAATSGGPSLVVAADRSLGRLRRVVQGAKAGSADLVALVADGRRPPLRSVRTVLVDAPCLGTGVLRRRADARWRVGADRLAALVRLQGALLAAAAELVEPGGTVVYATCSLEPEENEEQVAEFLKRNRGFSRLAPPSGAGLPPDVVGSDGELRVLPWQRGTDGSFAVRLGRAV